MAFIKEESEEMKIKETFRVKQENTEEQTKMALIKEESEDMRIEETFRVKQEDTEEQTKMALIKEESEDMRIEETFRVKQEDTEEQTKMVLIKEESEDLRIEETFRVKQEDTEEQTKMAFNGSVHKMACINFPEASVCMLTSDRNNTVREEEKKANMSEFKVKKNKLIYQRQERRSSLHCCVPQCANSSRYNSVISFHAFPIDPEVRAQWLARIRRDNFTPTKNTRVCSVHFKRDDFVLTIRTLRKLKKGTIPSLFAWNHYTLPTQRANV
ncbi:golgin subfamily A member 6-like protein 6 [Rhinichthys klamathensis goyatoka]|uniref:golgin subfamily A member 6-like protein 6 n=1 Tax=Rhinichthys klamathensis goyatoka TaxID=3034132 RepID=UPI0024B6080C|nr:golgin subfamily A member 6-like protein 6 [Rhinichthys klamathensis goyatoka]